MSEYVSKPWLKRSKQLKKWLADKRRESNRISGNDKKASLKSSNQCKLTDFEG